MTDGERIWHRHYPEGVPREIDADRFRSLLDVLALQTERFGPRPAFTCMGTTATFADIDRASTAFAAYLGHDLGLRPGERIAIMLPNVLQYPIALWGALRAGLTVVNTNPLYTGRELGHQLLDSGARAIVVLENFAHTLEKVIGETAVDHVVLTRLGDRLGIPKRWLVNFGVRYVKRMVPRHDVRPSAWFEDALDRGAGRATMDVAVSPDDVAFLQYTGGTTGRAKGAVLTHRNITANLQQAAAWMAPALREGEEVVVTALPLYHIFALTANLFAIGFYGGNNLLIPNPRDLKGFVATLRKERFTALPGVNTLFNGLLNTPGFADLDFSSLRLALGGGMAVQHSVAERWQAVTGVPILEAYGLTETSPAVTINPLDLDHFNGRIGVPLPSTDCRIESDDGVVLGVGEAGELCVRGPQVMQGYWNRPGETAEVLQDGWFRTGDVAVMDDDGFFELVDRKKDMILVSGFNVYPTEVEDVLASHPDVVEAGAIGIPDEHSGEVVRAVVVRRPGSDLDEKTLLRFAREQLTGYKAPKSVRFADELPKSNVGKILRKDLRERHGD